MGKIMIVAGIGCRRGAGERQVTAAIEAALAHHGIDRKLLGGLATGMVKQHEAAIFAAGNAMGLPVTVVSDAGLAAAGPRTVSLSELSLAMTGAPSVSEAAALAAIGDQARLLGPRLVVGPVTCALATDEPQP